MIYNLRVQLLNFIIVTTLTLSLEPSKKYFACERRLAFGKANMCFLYLLDHVTHVIFHFNALAFMGKTSRAKVAASYYALYKKKRGILQTLMCFSERKIFFFNLNFTSSPNCNCTVSSNCKLKFLFNGNFCSLPLGFFSKWPFSLKPFLKNPVEKLAYLLSLPRSPSPAKTSPFSKPSLSTNSFWLLLNCQTVEL